MEMHEQDIIAVFARAVGAVRSDVVQGIGDDCAILQVPAYYQLVTSCDTLNQDIHFPAFLPAYDIAYRAVAVNLSDLAACGAVPTWVQLAITLPEANATWLNEFARGVQAGLLPSGAQLVGGNVTRGPLAITLQVMGLVPEGKALLRSGARPGDKIYVSGELGAAALGLQCLLQQRDLKNAALTEQVITAWRRPQAQIELGIALRDVATAAIDISDGLMMDLGHICRLSRCGATVRAEDVPIAAALKQTLLPENYLPLALAGGEDYHLCFTVPPSKQAQLTSLQKKFNLPVNCLGEMQAQPAVEFIDKSGKAIHYAIEGYQHF